MKTKKGFNRRKHISDSSSHLEMVQAFHLANNDCVYNMNNPIQNEPVGHLAASFTTNAATRGENGDLFLWNLVISAPYTPSAIFNLASTNFIVFLGKNEFKWQFFKIGEQRLGQCGAKNVERFTILRVILAQGPC